MGDLTVFTFSDEFAIRVQKDEVGDPWFVGIDVAAVAGYADPIRAVRQHVSPRGRTLRDIDTKTGRKEAVFIDEGGVYELLIRSKLPRAQEFRDWVTRDVLPSIRKQGFYLAAPERVDTTALEAALDEVKREKTALLEKAEQTERAAVACVDAFMKQKHGYHDEARRSFESYQLHQKLQAEARWYKVQWEMVMQVLDTLDVTKQSERTQKALAWYHEQVAARERGDNYYPKFYD